MKKIVLIVFSGLFLFSLVACGDKNQVSSSSDTSSQSVDQQLPGSFGEEQALTEEEKEIFSEATAELVGVNYTPIAVSTQVVAGTNYRFRCSGEAAIASQDIKEYYITVYVSLNSEDAPTITDISEV